MPDDPISFDPIAYINEPRWRTMSLGLERIRALLHRLGDPQDELRFVHVAGTNGKGSTCACLNACLRAAGYKVGLFTSPYIERFEERIQVNGAPIKKEELYRVTLLVRDEAEAMSDHPTEFELMTAVAFLHFAQVGCDIVIAEVGLGGRLDSTNVITSVEASVIAPVSYDHCALLGASLSQIAGEKAGIIKQGVPVVSAAQEREAAEVLKAVAKEKQASLRFVNGEGIEGENEDFTYVAQSGHRLTHLALALKGGYQRSNAALAIEACEILREGGWLISEEALREGLASVVWPGRFELVSARPDIIVDGAHNIHAARQLVEELDRRYPLRRIIFVVAVMADKDYPAMLDLYAPIAKAFVCYAPAMERSLAANQLASQAMVALADLPEEDHGLGCIVQVASSPRQAARQALAMASENDVICCCGSLYGVAAIKESIAEALATNGRGA